jgi:hypothetical protein
MTCNSLERFGDYVVKMSASRHDHKNVSIVKNYLWVELCNFYRVHDPVRYGSLGKVSGSYQAHMLCFTMPTQPSKWPHSGTEARVVRLTEEELAIFAGLYSRFDVLPDLPLNTTTIDGTHQPATMDPTGLQIRGRLWCGLRFFRSYYFKGENDAKILGSGHCCVTYFTLNPQRCEKYGIIREIIQHQPYSQLAHPGSVYMFRIEELKVYDPVDDDYDTVPLPTAIMSGQETWVCEAAIFTDSVYCLQALDDDPSTFYVVSLLT